MTIARTALTACATVLLVAAPASAQEQFQWSGRIAEGRAIEIKGVNGAIRASASNSGEVRVTAAKRGRRSDPSDVRIEVVEHAGGVTICAVYPSRGNQPNECRPGSGGRMNVQNNDVQVEWTVHVPRGVNFVGRSVNGAIEGSGLPAGAEGRTVNGAVKLSAAGVVRANSVNGAVDVTMGRSDWREEVELKTVNGALTVRFAGDLHANVTARTVNGSIETDFPLTVRGRFTNRSLSGVVGNGGRDLTLETVNGSIRLLRN
jgi:hypothetical protein